MMYVSVNVFRVHAGTLAEFLDLQRDAFLPLLRQHAGFMGLDVVRTGEDTGVTTLWWASEEARGAATPPLNEWVGRHLAPYFEAVENPAGPLVVSWHAAGTGSPASEG